MLSEQELFLYCQ